MQIEILSIPKDKSSKYLDSIYALNQKNTPEVGSLNNEDDLNKLLSQSNILLCAFNQSSLVGFMVCMFEGSKYQSENYHFFSNQLSEFIYIDRIAVDLPFRQKGLGTCFYNELARIRGERSIICCEVNSKPLNEPSIRFHKKNEFEECGNKDFEDGHSVIYFKKILSN
tara:strand:- start:718 stop:1221 length:504 start_codon:yes stop_codon:yes gene_type:complete